MDRFDKFTDRARKVLTLAQDEAQRFNHNYIGTEHLLLGLVREGEGVAARVLENMNVELSKVRTAVEFIIGRGDRPVVGEVGLTPRAKRVIELAIDEARRLGHNYIGTEHLLLGLVREGEGIAAGVLESLGVNLDKVRHQVIHVLSQSSSTAPAQETKRPSKTPTLDQLGINLTDAARAGTLDPVIGREKEIERVIQILGRKTKNNPALIGEPGVGKTAIAEALAQRIVSGDVPETLTDKRVLTLDIGSLVGGHEVPRRVRGAAEEDHRGAAQLARQRPLHRRAAHAGRRGCRRGRHRRREHPQAAAEPRRAAVHRRHHARRVPQVHREGRGARAPLPAGHGRRADRRRGDRHPLRHPRAVRGAPPRQDQRRGHPRGGRPLASATSPTARCRTRRSTSSTRPARASGCAPHRLRRRSRRRSWPSRRSRAARTRRSPARTTRPPPACATRRRRARSTSRSCARSGTRTSPRRRRSSPTRTSPRS